MGSYQVSTPSFEAETADGKRRLTTVIARQVGQPGPGLVVVAHRDALGPRRRARSCRAPRRCSSWRVWRAAGG